MCCPSCCSVSVKLCFCPKQNAILCSVMNQVICSESLSQTGLPDPENKKCQTVCQIRPNILRKGQICQLLTVLKFLNIHMNTGIEAMLAG